MLICRSNPCSSKKAKGFKRYIKDSNKMLCHPEAMDLLQKLLTYDPEDRLTAVEAMNHPYFNVIRENESKGLFGKEGEESVSTGAESELEAKRVKAGSAGVEN